MNLMKTVIIIFFIIILAACSSKFDKYMTQGKELLVNKDYENALKQFELALIEKPSDADAKILRDQAKSGFDKVILDKKYTEYIKDNGKNFKTYVDLISAGSVDQNTNFNEYIEKLRTVAKDTDFIRVKWLDTPQIIDVHKIFVDSINERIAMIQAYLDMDNWDQNRVDAAALNRLTKYNIKTHANKSKELLEQYATNISNIRSSIEKK
jgi:hypothetical protein